MQEAAAAEFSSLPHLNGSILSSPPSLPHPHTSPPAGAYTPRSSLPSFIRRTLIFSLMSVSCRSGQKQSSAGAITTFRGIPRSKTPPRAGTTAASSKNRMDPEKRRCCLHRSRAWEPTEVHSGERSAPLSNEEQISAPHVDVRREKRIPVQIRRTSVRTSSPQRPKVRKVTRSPSVCAALSALRVCQSSPSTDTRSHWLSPGLHPPSPRLLLPARR